MAQQKISLSQKPRFRITNSNNGQRAYFDSAATNRLNEKHWMDASNLDINTIIRGDIQTLRNRCRYEILNNTYAVGIMETLADYVIGKGPRPQLSSENESFNEECEDKFLAWLAESDFTGTMDFGQFLRMQSIYSPCESGGSLTILKNDPTVGRNRASLRLLAVEMERLTDPLTSMPSAKMHDGIEFDENMRPAWYYILKSNPGDGYADSFFETDRIPANQVIHYYRVFRPGQHIGIPWLASALPLFAYWRRYTLATIQAAETAAEIAGILKNTVDPSTSDEEDIASNDVIELERNALLTVPRGWDMQQIKPEQPPTNYQMFKREIINEIARCVNMPYNLAAADSSTYNYASGRLDHQSFYRFVQTLRGQIEHIILNRIFREWLNEAWLIPGFFRTPSSFDDVVRAAETIQWFWPGYKHVDPVKEAQAEKIRLENGTLTLQAAYAEQGLDWEQQLRQRAKEYNAMKELGIFEMMQSEKKKEITDADDDENDE